MKSELSQARRPHWGRLVHAVRRWVDILALAALGAFAFEVILPFAWGYAKRTSISFAPHFVTLAAWLATIVLLFVVGEPIRIRRGQWRLLGWYPPLWLAVVFACVLAAGTEHLPAGFRPQVDGPDWQHFYPILFIAGALFLAGFLRQPPRNKRRPTQRTQQQEDSAFEWGTVEQWLSSGEQPISRHEDDLFQHGQIAERIAILVAREGRSVALLGRLGAGKSSIVNMVRSQLAALDPLVVVASMDIWAVPRPEDVPRLALSRIISALDDVVDTTRLRGLPESYRRLAAAEPSGWVSRVLGVDTAADSVDELRRLGPILEVLNIRLVLTLEDVERAGVSFDTRHLQRLLWALREVPRTAFLLAADPDHAVLDVGKLCDAIELVPPLAFDHVAAIVTKAHAHWMMAFSDVNPHSNRRDGDKLQLASARVGGMVDYMRRTGTETPLDALVALLQTPRALKHVLRRVDRAWTSLHGEVELDDLVIVTALRHGAEPVYQFLLTDIDAARHKPDDWLPRTKSVKQNWARVTDALSNAEAAQRLVDLLGIQQLQRDQFQSGTESPQGAAVAEPVDYFRRIVAEQLNAGELRDQQLLADVDRWRSGEPAVLVGKMVAATGEDEAYVARWEHFAFRHEVEELLALTDEVAARVLGRDGAATRADHPALIALWRRCNRRVQRDEHEDWLRDLILRAIPVSLNFVNDLYYYWTGEHGIVSGASRARIREAIIGEFKARTRSATDLVRVLTPGRSYNIGRLITETGQQTDVTRFAEWRDYFARLLVESCKERPDLMVAELSNLGGDTESSMVAAREQDPPVFINRYKLDRDRMAALFGGFLDAALEQLANYSGDNPYAMRSKTEAALWLSERRTP